MFDLAAMQWVTSTALTLTSVTIALVAVTFGYRQNFGWKPVILVLGHGASGGPSQADDYLAHIDFEVWNRRKYPIAIHFVEIKFGNLELSHDPEPPAPWYIFHNKLICREQVRLDPAGHQAFNAKLPFKKRSLDTLNETMIIEVYYFDPIANKRKTASIKHKFNFGETG